MKITFSKELTLQKADVYLKIEKKIIRKDIQDYLNGKTYNNPLVENRMKKYLQELKVYNDLFSLTSKGEKIRETGETFEAEEGKYTIWYVENDSVLGTKILFFERKNVEYNSKERRIGEFSSNFPTEGHFLLPSINKDIEFLEFNLREQIPYAEKYSTDKLFFKWVWDNLKSSHYEFEGTLGNNQIRKRDVVINRDLRQDIQKYFRNWNIENERFTVDFNRTEEEKRSFYSDIRETFEDYTIDLQQCPIMPNNKETALLWRDWLLEKRIKKEYLSVNDFEYEAGNVQEKEGLMMYELDLPKIDNFKRTRKADKLIKWHLQAPEDLNPNKEFLLSLSSKVIQIPEGSTFSFNDFASRLDIKTGDIIIYYDYYALKRPDLVEKLLDNFVDVSKKIIISQPFSLSESPEMYKRKNEETYNRCRSKFKIFNIEEKDEKRLHDRYLIIRKEGKWHILNGSNSLNGFIAKENRYNNTYITKASVIYAYVNENMLTENTINFLNKIANE
jgi:hypothetical protein